MKKCLFFQKLLKVLGWIMFVIICLAVANGIIGGNMYVFSHKPVVKHAKAEASASTVSTATVQAPILCRQVRVTNLTGAEVCLFETDNETPNGRRTKVLLEKMLPGETVDIATHPLGDESNRYNLFAQGGGFLCLGGEIKSHRFDLGRPQAEQTWGIK